MRRLSPHHWLIDHAIKEFHFVKGPRFIIASRLSGSEFAEVQSLSERGHRIELHVQPLARSKFQHTSIISIGPYDLMDDAEDDMNYIIANVPSLYRNKT